MAAEARIHVGDVGTRLVVTVVDEAGDAVDLSTATEMLIYLKGPGAVETEHEAEFDTDGVNGKIAYETEADVIDVAGLWRIQAKVTVGGRTWSTNPQSFLVAGNLY